ncbi:MAG: hypothetical protein QNJ97_13885 [Myxococcota bacterium]|nr:hypothetical protein [Myxococcota bacterium]
MGSLFKRHCVLSFFIICIVGFPLKAAASNIVYCDVNATGNNDGTSWENAFTNLNDAIDSLSSGEVWVKEGHYAGETIDLSCGVSIYGGFSSELTGQAGDIDQRDLTSDLTIIDGEGTRRCLYPASYVDLDGLSFQNCDADAGGVMYNSCSSYIRFVNCSFKNNTAFYSGGAIVSFRPMTFENCVFESNRAEYSKGGAVYIDETSSFTGCRFAKNHAAYGGALYLSGSTTITNSQFLLNFSEYAGGAMYLRSWADIQNTVIAFNTSNYGGGVRSKGDLDVYNSTIYSNRAKYYGAAIYGYDVWVINSIVWDNYSLSCYDATNNIYSTYYPDIYYSNLEDGWPGTGNISEDPKFLIKQGCCEVPFQIDGTSPCVDAGHGCYAMEHDIAGNARFDAPSVPNTGAPTPDYTDIGAYEFVDVPVENCNQECDIDEDALSDDWEFSHFDDLNQDGDGDADGDGISNYLEFLMGTDPTDSTAVPTSGHRYRYDSLGRVRSITRVD